MQAPPPALTCAAQPQRCPGLSGGAPHAGPAAAAPPAG